MASCWSDLSTFLLCIFVLIPTRAIHAFVVIPHCRKTVHVPQTSSSSTGASFVSRGFLHQQQQLKSMWDDEDLYDKIEAQQQDRDMGSSNSKYDDFTTSRKQPPICDERQQCKTARRETEYDLPDHIHSNVVEATRKVAFSIATEGVGEKVEAHGCLFIVGNAALLCSEKQKFGRVRLPDKNYSKPPWGQNDSHIRYNVLSFVPSNEEREMSKQPSLSKEGIQSLCKEDGGIVIDGVTGDVWCGNYFVNDLSRGKSSGGARGAAASSIAVQAGGCFAIKVSEDSCGSISKPLPRNAMIEVYPCSPNCRKEPIPTTNGDDNISNEDERLLQQTLDPLQATFIVKQAMESYTPGTREWIMKRFDEWFDQEDDKQNKSKVLVLSAKAGLGKTTIASKIVSERSNIVIAYHFCRHDESLKRNPKRMLLSLAYQLAKHIPAYKKGLLSLIKVRNLRKENLMSQEYNLMSTFDILLKEPLSSIKENPGKFVILIDALDECEHAGENNILDCIRDHFIDLPSWLRLFVTTRPEVPMMEELKDFQPESLQPESNDNQKDLRLFFEKLIEGHTEETDTKHAVDKLVERSEGLFVYARLLADTISDKDGKITKKITKKMLDELPDGINKFYKKQFTRILDTESNANWDESIEWRIVGMIVAAAEPLHLKLLQQFTGKSKKQVRDAVKKISRFFPQDDNKKLHTYHKSLVDWLTLDDNGSDFYVNIEEQERLFANQCWSILDKCSIPGSTAADQIQFDNYDSVVVEYILQHGVMHLCSAKMKEKARRLVLDVGWLIKAAERAESRNNLVLDFERLNENDRVMELIGRAIGLALNAMQTDHRQLPGQLIGRLGGGSPTATTTVVETEENKQIIKDKDFQSEIMNFIERMKEYSYGYQWWCPVHSCWDQASNACIRIFKQHTSRVRSIAWSPDGKRLASGSDDNTIRFWDTTNGDCQAIMKGHTYGMTSIAWSPDGKQLASGSGDKTIRLWDTTNGDCQAIMKGHTSRVRSIAWSPDGKRLASGSLDKTIRLWDTTNGDCIAIMKGHIHGVISIAWSPDSKQLASASDDKTIRLWDTTNGDCKAIMKGHTHSVISIAWSPDGKQLASGSADKTTRLWDITNGDCKAIMKGHTYRVESIAWSPDGKQLASGSADKTIRLWDTTNGDCKANMKGHTDGVESIAWSPDGKQLASGSDDTTIRLWDTTNGDCKANVKGHTDDVTSIAWSPDGKRLASGSLDKTIRLWDTTNGDCIAIRKGHTRGVISIAWSPDGKRLASGSNDKTIRLWDTTNGDCKAIMKGHTYGVISIAWSPDGKRLASGSADKTIRLWDTTNGDCKAIMKGHTSYVTSIAWSPDGKQLASGSNDKSIRLWDTTNGDCKAIMNGHTDGVESIAWSPDGKRLASGSDVNTIRLWDTTNGDYKAIMNGHTDGMTSIAWSPDGKQLASGSADKTIRLWDTMNGGCKAIMKGHTSRVRSIAWSPDGKRLTSRSNDSTIRIWNVSSGLCLKKKEANSYSRFHTTETGIAYDDLSNYVGDDSSMVGIECLDVSIKGEKACAITNMNSIGFFKLKKLT